MKSNQLWAALSRTLAVATVALIVVLMLVPGASAAGKYKVLHKFNGTDGAFPNGGLIFDAAGNQYGVTNNGGAYGNGTVFQLTPNSDGSWTENILYSFTGGNDGGIPSDDVIFDANGRLYGTSVNGGDYGYGTVFKLTPNLDGSWTESVLHSFTGGSAGQNPGSGVAFDAAGSLYGTTGGGTYGFSAVFKLAPNSDGTWTESMIYSFKSRRDSAPTGSVVFDGAGNLYGTTTGWQGSYGNGLVYELIPQQDGSWQAKALHRFTPTDPLGWCPGSTPVFDGAGSLYTAAYHGGGRGCGEWNGCGTVFKLTPGSDGRWKGHVLYRFKGGRDAEQPAAGVVFDTAGNLYGTTLHGGGGQCSDFWGGSGCGTVFKLTPNSQGGWTEQVLHRFRGAGNPWGGLVLDGMGNTYGMASGEGTSGSSGAVFEITP